MSVNDHGGRGWGTAKINAEQIHNHTHTHTTTTHKIQLDTHAHTHACTHACMCAHTQTHTPGVLGGKEVHVQCSI